MKIKNWKDLFKMENMKQEAYYGMLVKYREELRRPIEEAEDFMQRIEAQLNSLCNGSFQILPTGTFFFSILYFHLFIILWSLFILQPIWSCSLEELFLLFSPLVIEGKKDPLPSKKKKKKRVKNPNFIMISTFCTFS